MVWRDGSGNVLDAVRFRARVYATRQHDAIAVRHNRDILGPEGERLVPHDGLSDPASGVNITGRLGLVQWRDARLALIRCAGGLLLSRHRSRFILFLSVNGRLRKLLPRCMSAGGLRLGYRR